ncbi:MAG: isopeptide-forming domain-containing fimbrial protein [Solobacterium sp.]|nr:isopeptide-forming domain-containing fimbrial protein [Solobacterium sp.]MBR2794295.1 isopeptide-forming domain-containing fimbrial protein [Solobacterium sp.]MBR3311824.1 isopeptide-forming domain-containing fimbrial protein [Solobacterium sp.]
MKHIKNFISAVISFLVIAMMFSISAFAEDPTYTIAVRNEATGYTYEAYQIFSGTYASEKLADITWGSGITEAGKTALYNKYSIPAASRTAEAVAEAIEADDSSNRARELAKCLNDAAGALDNAIAMPYSESIVIGSSAAFKGYAASSLHAGYYLVVNKSIPAGDDSVYSDYIVQLVNDVAVEPKSEKPASLKKVQDINDSDTTPQLSALQDSADYDIGDKVPFTLTATLPADYDKYEQYYLKLEDDMSKGLSLDKSITIFFGAEDTTGDTVSPSVSQESSYTGGKVYSYTIPDLKESNPNLTSGDVITIKYEAILNSNAVIGSAGNPNKYRIEFSNNPNEGGLDGPKGTTPWDENVVFTYQTIFNKADTDHHALTGADFKLEKLVNGIYTDVTTFGSGSNRPTKTGSTSGSTFTFSGLADGQYRLTEITTPAGYNTISPIVFTISASHDTTSDHPALIALTGTDGADFTMTPNVTDGSLTAEIVNKSGIALPSTGGTGTTLFRITGVLVVILAGFFFVSSGRKKH